MLAVRAFSGEATSGDLSELADMLDSDSSLEARYEYLKAYWESKNSLVSDLDTAFSKVAQKAGLNNEATEWQEPMSIDLANERRPGWRKVIARVSVAAAVLVFVLAGYMFYKGSQKSSTVRNLVKTELKTEQNPRGTTSVIYLEDSTRVVLNADSKLQFPETFDDSVREVYLTGEAFFDVTRNEQKPFIIHAGRMNIKVLGTEFNVRSYPDDSTSEASLIRGLIEVTLADRPTDKIILKPSEKLIVSNDSFVRDQSELSSSLSAKEARLQIGKLHYVSPVDSTVMETSWLNNKMVFKDESFYRLARDLERKYDVNIQFRNDIVKEYRFTGAFEKESIHDVLEALSLTEKFNYTIKKDSITIY